MEGITGLITFGGIVAAFFAIFLLRDKFRKYVDTGIALANPVFEIAKIVVDIFVKDEDKKEEVLKYLGILGVAVNSVSHKKSEIDATLPADAPPKIRHDAYEAAALELAEEVANEQGIQVDVMSKSMIRMAIDLFLSFSQKGEVTNVDLKKYINH
jgi:hypothetical protein